MTTDTNWQSSTLHTLVRRLKPGADLKEELSSLAQSHIDSGGCILTCTGSLTKAVIRLAGSASVEELEGPFEILSLSGTLSQDGVHLHISLGNEHGECRGGHLMTGSIIATTAEIVVGVLTDLEFQRANDEATGYSELTIMPRKD